MKYLLTPLTMLVWAIITYFGMYAIVLSIMYVFSISWFWLIAIGTILIGLIFAISTSIPSLLRILILKIYGINWFSCISHSIAGVIGVIAIINLFYENPPEMYIDGEYVFFIKGMWRISAFKSIVLLSPYIGLLCAFFWSSIIAPIYMIVVGKNVIE